MSVSAPAVPAASPSPPISLNDLNGVVWRAAGFGATRFTVTPTGHAALDRELPNRGWPHGGLVELLLQQGGIGEMQLLQPALQHLGRRRIALLQPPHLPQIAAWRDWGLPPERLLWVRATRHADALWSAEQILRNGSCGALLFWPGTVRHESLRRLQLAAQASDLLCWLLRPLADAGAPSPAPLRIALRPLSTGIQLDILKRRGPHCAAPIALHWLARDAQAAALTSPVEASDALLDRRPPALAAAAIAAPALV